MAGPGTPEIQKLIENVCDQFRHLNNPRLKNSFSAIAISSDEWRLIERLTSPAFGVKAALQRYGFAELYEQVLAAAKFVYYVRKQIASNPPMPLGATLFDKMAIRSLPANLNIMADQLRTLYGKLLLLDAEDNPEPICHSIPELDRTLFYLQSSS
jgi:hypothetical protein